MRSKWPLIVIGLIVVGITVPALFWYGTWFGVRLDDSRLEEYLADGARPRQVQHALEEVTRRLDEGRPGVDRWTRRVVEVSHRKDESVRIACAWAMQYDPGRPEFVERLRELVRDDPSPLVRRNAATSLAAAGDATGLDVLRAMLRPFPVHASAAGRLVSPPAVGRFVRHQELLLRLDAGEGSLLEVRAPVPGKTASVDVAEGAEVVPGDVLVVLAPSAEQVLNAVLGLGRVGTVDDVEALSLVASERSGYAEGIRRSARAALAAIEGRSGE
jgi:biotin carboxyl carrier protein